MPPSAMYGHASPSKKAVQKQTRRAEIVSARETALPIGRRTITQAAAERFSQELRPARLKLAQGRGGTDTIGVEIVRELEKLHDDSGGDSPNVPAVHVKMRTGMATRREMSVVNKIGLRHQGADRHGSNFCRLAGIEAKFAARWNHSDNWGDDQAITRHKLIQPPEHSDTVAADANLLVTLAQRRCRRVGIPRVDSAAGESDLSLVSGQMIGSSSKNEIFAVRPLLD